MKDKSPIELMMDEVVWLPIPDEAEPSDIPHVTHTGYLDILGYSLPVLQLSNGERVIEEHDLEAFFKWMEEQ